MVKLFVMIPRAPHVSPQEFHDHWRHPHASLGRDIPALIDLVQSHQFDSEHLDEHQASFEAIGESWFESLQHATGQATDAHYLSYVQPDEINFIDMPKLDFLFTDEDPILERATEEDGIGIPEVWWYDHGRPTSIKLLQFVTPDGNPDWTSDKDRERQLGLRIGSLKHVRAFASEEAHGDSPPYLGVRELWWPTLTAFERGIAADPEAWNELRGLAGSSLDMLVFSERWPKRPSS